MADTTQDPSEQGGIKQEYNIATTGLNLDQSLNQVPKGKLTYALNAAVENFDANSVNYQNEPGNELCVTFPIEFVLIGTHYIQEKSKHIFFITNPGTGDSEIGYMDNNDCQYKTLASAKCLNFKIEYPIHKVVHKITNCATEIYWTDGFNDRRYLNIDDVPYQIRSGSIICDPVYTDVLDCNQIKVQPNFSIPEITISKVVTGGSLISGTYQFAVQYCDVAGNAYTSYYSVTNPLPIADVYITTPNFNYEVGKSIRMTISNLDLTGQFQYFNVAVIKTINNIPSVELIGIYFIESVTKNVTYTGQNTTDIKLTIADIFQKYPYYDIAQDLTVVQDILVWDQLTTIDRINYQQIANSIQLQWETYRIPATENYAEELNATNLRGYLRDEVYAFEIVFLLKNGKQTDGFHIPGRPISPYDFSYPDVPDTNPDFIGEPEYYDIYGVGYSPWWKIYNTGRVLGFSNSPDINNATAYQFGEFAYWESIEQYPCNVDVWGDLAGQYIRHHKFPDVLVSPIFEDTIDSLGGLSTQMQNCAVFPIGARIDTSQLASSINLSNLTNEQKADIVGFKIVRGDRTTNKSIVGKGILRNVNKYERDDQTYFFPNYPYNDLSGDPFINQTNNAYAQICEPWLIICTEGGEYQFTDCNRNKPQRAQMVAGTTYEICSTTKPTHLTGGATIGPGNYDMWLATGCDGTTGYDIQYSTPFTTDNTALTAVQEYLNGAGIGGWGSCDTVYRKLDLNGQMGDTCGGTFDSCSSLYYKLERVEQDQGVMLPDIGRISKLNCSIETPLEPIRNITDIGYRQIFNSPETSFGQPFLGNILKLENVIYGNGIAHFTEVRKNAKYKLLSEEAQRDALKSSEDIANYTDSFNASAMFAAYQSYLTIYVNGITRKNYAYSFNSIASYDNFANIDNGLQIKQRKIDRKQYLIPGVQSVGDEYNINNYQRESSVFIRTTGLEPNEPQYSALPFPDQTPSLLSGGTSIVKDYSRFTIGDTNNCSTPGLEQPIKVVSYYASMKNVIDNQWGQIYSYETIDTGFQFMFNETVSGPIPIFGGDTFINRFTFKTKLPYFIDNRVGAPDDSDIFYDEIGNVGYPKYWHSARSILENYSLRNGTVLANFISYKAHNFDCPNDPATIAITNTGSSSNRTFYDGYFYLFAYGVPNFYCESSYNVDLRQAFNNKEGDFWPHVNTSIPDDWVQESYVPIAQDNTYNYNVTFSKQNRENTFTHLPPDWEGQLCYTNYPFRGIYSEPQVNNADNRVNNWLTYLPLSLYDFPQNYGNLTSLDGIQNKAILARFENKSLLYNNLLTINTSNPQAAYVGNPKLFAGAPPIDFAETDLGYVGSQNKFLLKIPQGQITVDAKRGQVFLISGTQAVDLSQFGSGVNRFFTDHLAFEVLRYFPQVDTDNHFNGIGLHGVYDSKFDRVILTKLDYIPIDKDIKYDPVTKEYYIETTTYMNGPTTTTTTSSTSTTTTSTSSTTTTTTTLVCNSYKYSLDLYRCANCTSFGAGEMYNAVPLIVGGWYIYQGYKVQVSAFLFCSQGGTLVNIAPTYQTSCIALTCPTTTTTTTLAPGIYYHNASRYNCGVCTNPIGGGSFQNSQPLTPGKWYLTSNGTVVYIISYDTYSPGVATNNVLDSNQENNCIDITCL
jgi:hypothetical protein